MKELKEAIKTLWRNITNILRSPLRNMPWIVWSWNDGKPNQVFQFLLEQADQGDLDMAKEKYADEYYAKFRQAIDEAPKPSHPQDQDIIVSRKGSTCFSSACLDHQ